MCKIYFRGTKMSEQTSSDSLTLTMSPADLSVMAKAMEKSVISMQMEFAELEKKAVILKQDIDRQVAMLNIIKSSLKS
jgi:hypothetical protein